MQGFGLAGSQVLVGDLMRYVLALLLVASLMAA